MSKILLVTGGSGFIGSNYINHIFYKNEYDKIINIDILHYCADHNNVLPEIRNSSKYKFYNNDICDYEIIEKILIDEKISHIIHFAAQSHVDNSFNESLKYTHDNVYGTHNILEAIKNINKNIVMIHFSTDEVYGESSLDDLEKTEESILCPTNPYAASKAAAEMYVKSYIHSFGLKIIITRGNNVFGNNQYPEKLIPKFIKLLNENKKCTIHGTGENIRNFIHVNDVCRAVDLIFEFGSFGQIYNIGNDMNGEKTVLEVAKYLVKKIKKTDNIDKYLDFVLDRPFNDKRYLISNKKLKELGWDIKENFNDKIDELIEGYISNSSYGFIIYINDNNKIKEIYDTIREKSENDIIFICKSKNENLLGKNLKNTRIIISEFDFCNNLISYYYFFVNKYFDKAIILDDEFNFNILDKLLLLAQKDDFINISEKEIENNLNETNMLEFIVEENMINDNDIIKQFHNKNKWKGCNRLLSICNYNTLKIIQENYNLFYYLKNMDYQTLSYFENIFGFLFYYNKIKN